MFKNIYLNLLNLEAKFKWKERERIKKLISLNKGDCIADVGSGGGFLTYDFAQLVGEKGTVYAVDIEKYNLQFILKQCKNKGINNIKTVTADFDSPGLEDNSVDVIFSKNMFHHLQDPVSYFKNCRNSLKENGKVIIIDFKKTDKNKHLPIISGKHYTDEEKIIDSMDKAGYVHVQSQFLDENHSFNIFSVK